MKEKIAVEVVDVEKIEEDWKNDEEVYAEEVIEEMQTEEADLLELELVKFSYKQSVDIINAISDAFAQLSTRQQKEAASALCLNQGAITLCMPDAIDHLCPLEDGKHSIVSESLKYIDTIDTYEPEDWRACPRVKGGNINGFLYDWRRKDAEASGEVNEFFFIGEDGKKYYAVAVGDGQVELYESTEV